MGQGRRKDSLPPRQCNMQCNSGSHSHTVGSCTHPSFSPILTASLALQLSWRLLPSSSELTPQTPHPCCCISIHMYSNSTQTVQQTASKLSVRHFEKWGWAPEGKSFPRTSFSWRRQVIAASSESWDSRQTLTFSNKKPYKLLKKQTYSFKKWPYWWAEFAVKCSKIRIKV